VDRIANHLQSGKKAYLFYRSIKRVSKTFVIETDISSLIFISFIGEIPS
jgi:hypothetical protein